VRLVSAFHNSAGFGEENFSGFREPYGFYTVVEKRDA